MNRSAVLLATRSKAYTFWRSLNSTVVMEQAYRTDQAFQNTDERPFTLSEIVRRMLKVKSRCEKAKAEADDKEYALLRGEYKYFMGKKLDMRSASPAELISFLQCCVYFGFYDTHSIDLCLEEIELKTETLMPNEVYHLLLVLPKLPSKSEGNEALLEEGGEGGGLEDHFERMAAETLSLQKSPVSDSIRAVKSSYMVAPSRSLKQHPSRNFDNGAEQHRRDVNKSRQYYLLGGKFFSGLCDRALEWMEAYEMEKQDAPNVNTLEFGVPQFACYSLPEQIELLGALKPGDSANLFSKLLENLYMVAQPIPSTAEGAEEDNNQQQKQQLPPLQAFFQQEPSSLVAVMEGITAFLPPLLEEMMALRDSIDGAVGRLERIQNEPIRTPKGHKVIANQVQQIKKELSELRERDTVLKERRDIMLDSVQLCVDVAWGEGMNGGGAEGTSSMNESEVVDSLSGMDECETITFDDADAAVASAAEAEARALDPEYQMTIQSTAAGSNEYDCLRPSAIPAVSANKMENSHYAKRDPLSNRNLKRVGPTMSTASTTAHFTSRLSPQDIASLSLCVTHITGACYSARLFEQFDEDLTNLPQWLFKGGEPITAGSGGGAPTRIPALHLVRSLQKVYMVKQAQWCSDSVAAMMGTVRRLTDIAEDITVQCHYQLENGSASGTIPGSTKYREVSLVLKEAKRVSPLKFYTFLYACQSRIHFFSTSFSSGELANVTSVYLSCLTEAAGIRAGYEVGLYEAWSTAYDALSQEDTTGASTTSSTSLAKRARSVSSPAKSLIGKLRLGGLPGTAADGEEDAPHAPWKEAIESCRPQRPDALLAHDRFNATAIALTDLLEETYIHFTRYSGYGKKGVNSGSFGGSGGAEDGSVVALVLLEAMSAAVTTLESQTAEVRKAKNRMAQCSTSQAAMEVSSAIRPLQLPMPSPFPPRQHWQQIVHLLGTVVVQTCPYYSLDECLTALTVAGKLRYAMLDAAVTATIIRLRELIPTLWEALDDRASNVMVAAKEAFKGMDVPLINLGGSSGSDITPLRGGNASVEVQLARRSQLKKAEAARMLLAFLDSIKRPDEVDGDGDREVLVLAPQHVSNIRLIVAPAVRQYTL